MLVVSNSYVLEKPLCQTLKAATAKYTSFFIFLCPTYIKRDKTQCITFTMILTKLESDNTENYNFLVTLPVVPVDLDVY